MLFRKNQYVNWLHIHHSFQIRTDEHFSKLWDELQEKGQNWDPVNDVHLQDMKMLKLLNSITLQEVCITRITLKSWINLQEKLRADCSPQHLIFIPKWKQS